MLLILPIFTRNLCFKCIILLHLLNNRCKIHGFWNPALKFHGFRGTSGTHANKATVYHTVVKENIGTLTT